MNATELYRAGRLREAIDAQVAEVKARPTDQGLRLFLFELLAFSGELDRARRQVDAVHHGQPDLDLATLGYRKLIDSEAARRRFFDEGVPPEVLGEETLAIRLRIEAAGQLRLGRPAEATALLEQADEATPPVHGTLNGKPFATLRDADDLFGGVLEVMAQGKYFWVALEQVVGLGMTAPRFSRATSSTSRRGSTSPRSRARSSCRRSTPAPTSTPTTRSSSAAPPTGRAPKGGRPSASAHGRSCWTTTPIGLLEWREFVLDDPASPTGG